MSGIDAISTLSVAMVGLGAGVKAGTPREVLEAIAARFARAGARGVQLDATLPGFRPRELDRSARRDLAGTLRRLEMACSGVDAFVPSEHFLDRATVDRAANAVIAAIELAGDLGTLCNGGRNVCVAFPEKISHDVRESIIESCERCGVRLADTVWPQLADPHPHVGVGFDPAAVLAAGQDPAIVAAGLGQKLVVARVSDVASGIVGVRCEPGSGRGKLDIDAYHAALEIIGHTSMPVVDLRGVNLEPETGQGLLRRWSKGRMGLL